MTGVSEPDRRPEPETRRDDGSGPPSAVGSDAAGDLPRPSRPSKVDLPETLGYRLKNRLLGPPIASDRQTSERLGKPTALAVLSSDVHLVLGVRHRADADPAGDRGRGGRATRW